MVKIVKSPGSATIINAIATGYGSAFGIYVDDVFLYTHNNCKYNTLGLWKWGGGYNSISNMDLII